MADHKGKPPHNLLCDAQKGTNPAYREGYERIFGKKPLPHGDPAIAPRKKKYEEKFDYDTNDCRFRVKTRQHNTHPWRGTYKP